MSYLDEWVTHCSKLFNSGQGNALVDAIPLSREHPVAYNLVQAVYNIPETALEHSLSNAWDPSRSASRDAVPFFLAVLKYLGSLAQTNDGPQEAIDTFQRLNTVHTEANRLYGFAGPDGAFVNAFMNPLMVELGRQLVRVAQEAASLSPHPPRSNISARSIRDTTRQTIEKTFQTSSSIVSESEWSVAGSQQYLVGDIVWALANILWRIYAERKLHTQASGLAKSFQSLNPNEDKRISGRALVIKQTDLCESYYWRGKLGVVLLDMRNAKFWLDKAWQLCPWNCFQQQRAILIRLIPVNLLLGYFPTMALLQRYKLLEFVPLLQAFRTGNVIGFRHELAQNREWYRSRSVWLLLYERAEVLVWRNLFRQALKRYYALDPDAPKNRCPTWVFIAAAQTAMEGSSETQQEGMVIEDIICIISSLIDQSLILGHLSYSNAQLVMKPSADGMGGFPRLSQVVPRHIEANV